MQNVHHNLAGDVPLIEPVPQEFLEPIGASQPCGPSLEYDNEYIVLQARLNPKGENIYTLMNKFRLAFAISSDACRTQFYQRKIAKAHR